MDIKYVKGVGEKRSRLFNKLGVFTVGQLLRLFPRDYINFADHVRISEAVTGESCCVKAVIDREPVKHMIRKGMTLYKTAATDGESVMGITIFNNVYLAEMLRQGEEYYFYGKITYVSGRAEMSSPIVEKADSAPLFRPVYPQTAGLTSKGIGNVIRNALELYKNGGADILDETLRREYKLCTSLYAYKNIHFPQSMADAEAAKKRLIFEELLVLQLGMIKLKRGGRGSTQYRLCEDLSEEFFSSLPFEPTAAQRRAVAECVADMRRAAPMNRLLQGDVGSGKTAVAAAVMYSAVKSGMQCAMMAPTEILAQQHFQTLEQLFENTGIRIALLCGSTRAAGKKQIKAALAGGEIDIIVGTHALIQDDVQFKDPGFVITDEQHRFGVRQRGELGGRGGNPHTLVMSATPIPRTLALIVYGDLDISVLDELPPGRQRVSTYCVTSDYRKRVYAFIRKHLDAGLQAYIVCPLVEQGDDSELAAALEYKEQLEQGEFSGYSVGLLHGRMKPAEKEKAMQAFYSGETGLLVCTTVIEVGVDVPNAAVMLIENAERFGLSQLHQLRGRVGRGKDKASCILITDARGDTAKRRMRVMCETNDGFQIADEDLLLRGPGDFFGSRQHGLPELHISDMLDDMVTLRQAQAAAKKIISDDPSLLKREHKALAREVTELFSQTGTRLN